MSAVDAYLPLGLTVESLLAYTVGAVTFASVIISWSALLDRRPVAARLRAVTRHRLELQAQAAGGSRRRARAALPPGLITGLSRRLHRLQSAQTERAPRQAAARRVPVAGGCRHLRWPQAGLPVRVRVRRLPPGLWAACRRRPDGLPAVRHGRGRPAGLSRPRHLSVQHRNQATAGAAEGAARRPGPAGHLRRGGP